MVQTVLGLVFLSTAFIITFLINNIQKYKLLAQEIQAKYLWGEHVDQISSNEVMIDYQKYRTMRIEIGITILLCFGIFSVAMSSLLLWAIEIYKESVQEQLWAYIILLFLIFVFLFEINQFVSCSGDEGIIKIINSIIASQVNGLDIDFREFSRRKIVQNKGISRPELDKKLRKNYLGKTMFKISQYANELSFTIISGQFILFYIIVGLEFTSIIWNIYIIILMVIIYLFAQGLYIFRIKKLVR